MLPPAPASGGWFSVTELSGLVTLTFDIWPWNWFGMSAEARTTFLPILVFLRLCQVMGNTRQTDDMTL